MTTEHKSVCGVDNGFEDARGKVWLIQEPRRGISRSTRFSRRGRRGTETVVRGKPFQLSERRVMRGESEGVEPPVLPIPKRQKRVSLPARRPESPVVEPRSVPAIGHATSLRRVA